MNKKPHTKDSKINKEALKKILQKTQKKAKIIAITKNFSIKAVNSAIKNKIKIIGENKIQEAEKKFLEFKNRKKIELHFVGHLQSNKTKKAVQLFDVIETADSEKIIKKINNEAKKIKKKQKIFLQINIGKDPKKYGFKKGEINKICSNIKKLKNITIKGLMTILPQEAEKKEQKKYYKEMEEIKKKTQKTHFKTCKHLSMGMSKDYEIALKNGATLIRIGTLLFGKRK